MEDQDDDPVVRELDVFLSQELRDSLYLLQFPLRPANKPFLNEEEDEQLGVSQSSLVKARIKPQHLKLEVSYPLDTASECYDDDIGQELAKNADKEVPLKDDERPPKMFEASSAVPQNTHYTLAVLSDGEVHISPIHALLQMRPSFGHLDEADRKVKAQDNPNAVINTEEDEGKALQVTFKRRETERAVAAKKRSHTFLKQKETEEPWVDLEYVPVQAEESAGKRSKLFSAYPEQKMVFPQTPSQYLKTIEAKREIPSAQQKHSTGEVPLRDLKIMTLTEQIRKLLLRAHVLKLDDLCRFISADKRQILEHLRRDAHLLDGCWVVKSKLVYPTVDTKIRQIPSQTALRRGRDYLLLQFYQNQSVTRTNLLEHTKLPVEDLEHMLGKVGKKKKSPDASPGGWVFKMEPDETFLEEYPDEVLQQAETWQSFKKSLEGSIRSSAPVMDVHRTMEGIVEPGGKVDSIVKDAVTQYLQEHIIASVEQLVTAVQAADELVEGMTVDELCIIIMRMKLAHDATTSFDGTERRRFAYKDPDSKKDKYRTAILNVFKTTAQVQRKDIQEAIKREKLPDMSGSLYQRRSKKLQTLKEITGYLNIVTEK